MQDYGNAESDRHDDGAGTMEALYFGNHAKAGCPGTLPEYPGPWIAVDMESERDLCPAAIQCMQQHASCC